MSKTVLVIGAGGREHALAWALAKSPSVSKVYVAPGNAGTTWSVAEGRAEAINVAIPSNDLSALLRFALDNAVNLTVVGSEDPLVMGIVDQFTAAGLMICGATAAAAHLEGSKTFAKAFMERHGIPTAAYGSFTDYEEARDFVEDFGHPIVVKVDGLAEGKGVVICDTTSDADAALRQMMLNHQFGAAGDQVVVEERLTGPEASALAFCDGKYIALMPIARDHKRALDGDQGLNTGGMGAICPVPDVNDTLRAEIEAIIQRTIDGMAAEGMPYHGVLFAGLMLTPNGIRVLEFNCRFGDPETEAILPLFDGDLAEVLAACATGTLDQVQFGWKPGASAAIMLASGGYPGAYAKGLLISGLDREEADTVIFHAGTARKDDQVVTTRGRVLAVSARGDTLDAALDKAYQRITGIDFDGMQYRRDIGRTVASIKGQGAR